MTPQLFERGPVLDQAVRDAGDVERGLLQPHQIHEMPVQRIHGWAAVREWGGSWWGLCACGTFGPPCLTEDEAWTIRCEVEEAELAGRKRAALIGATV